MGWPPVIVELGASKAMERWNVTEPKLSYLWHPSRTVTSELQWRDDKRKRGLHGL